MLSEETPSAQPSSPRSNEENLAEPVIVFDGNCEHDYYEIGMDTEGCMEAACRNCPMGRRYKPDEFQCIDGKIEPCPN